MDLGLTPHEVTQLIWNLARALLILVAGLVVARVVRGWILRLGLSKRVAVNLAALLGNLAQVGIIILALILIAPTFGVDWGGLLTLLGAVGLAISLAFQDLLKNIIAGIYILIERPFQIGNVIVVGRDGLVVGTVQSIELRVTNLRTEEGLQVIVPNSTLFTEVVTNRSAFNLQRSVIEISVNLDGQTVAHLSSQISEVLAGVKDVCSAPTPATRVDSLTPQALKAHIEFWTPPAAGRHAAGEAALALQTTFPSADVTVVH